MPVSAKSSETFPFLPLIDHRLVFVKIDDFEHHHRAVRNIVGQHSYEPGNHLVHVVEANIRQWLKKMTLEEKIGQMCEITIDVVTDFEASKKNGFTLSEAKLDTVIG